MAAQSTVSASQPLLSAAHRPGNFQPALQCTWDPDSPEHLSDMQLALIQVQALVAHM